MINEFYVMIFALFIVMFVVGCQSTGNITQNTQNTNQNTEPIRIGSIGPLTGDIASIGQSELNGAKLAADEINAKGGIDGRQIQIIAEDGKCSGTDAINAMNKLVFTNQVKYIVGGVCSTETLSVAPIANDNKIVMISPTSSSPTITTAGDYIFRNYPSDSFAGKVAAEYAYNKGARNVAILSCLTDYCAGLKDVFTARFTELGGKIIETQQFANDAKDLRTQLTKIQSKTPDMIYVNIYSEATVVLLQQAQAMNIPAEKFLAGDTWADPTIWTQVKNAGDGAHFILGKSYVPDNFKQKYIAKYGKDAPMTFGATQAYDAVYLFKKAIEQTGDNSQAVKTALYDVQNYQGASGIISFDSNGDLKDASFDVWIVKDGKPVIEN